MHFCSNCQNKYYIRIDEDNVNKLVYYCRCCGNEDKLLNVDNVTVSRTQIKKSEQSFGHIINKYTKLDPTLPRISSILCPNPDCATNKEDAKREIIYIRYDDINLKYVNMCTTCDTIWESDTHHL